ncbi:hypothetical protein O6H91_10G015200 [Diphasiastrum complanatum]|uniref:Uncharacterized protein n=1 Tax=Diphasiastrum complanatum TaxID=34168 RepID=A0ACC2CEV0_DIPCM|nr:hypothetical protein O6H91_10G015200 [Diphasiastrum complanatum]
MATMAMGACWPGHSCCFRLRWFDPDLITPYEDYHHYQRTCTSGPAKQKDAVAVPVAFFIFLLSTRLVSVLRGSAFGLVSCWNLELGTSCGPNTTYLFGMIEISYHLWRPDAYVAFQISVRGQVFVGKMFPEVDLWYMRNLPSCFWMLKTNLL